jgi:hypothetical protein
MANPVPAVRADAPSYLTAGGRRVSEEEIARRAYEISLTAEGGTPEANRARAEEELRNQRRAYP